MIYYAERTLTEKVKLEAGLDYAMRRAEEMLELQKILQKENKA